MTWLFWISTALIFYTYFGYSAWLWACSRWRSVPVHTASYAPFVSIVMIVRESAEIVRSKLNNLLSLDYPENLLQFIIVSDGAGSATESLLREFAADSRIHVVLNQFSVGKAACLNSAFELVHGEVVVFTDTRQMLEPGAVKLLVENFADPTIGCVSGELMIGQPDFEDNNKGIAGYWRVEKTIRQLESRTGSVVGATGALYAVRGDLLSSLPAETILDDVYIPMEVVRQGFRIIFDSRARAWDQDQGTEREFHRKVRTLSGNYQLLSLAPWLLTRKNPILFRFVCHKLLRLIVPFALAAMLLSSLALESPFYRASLYLQLAFYGLSLLRIVGVKHGKIAAAADAVFTFLMLNTAAVVAFANFVTGRKPAWSR